MQFLKAQEEQNMEVNRTLISEKMVLEDRVKHLETELEKQMDLNK